MARSLKNRTWGGQQVWEDPKLSLRLSGKQLEKGVSTQAHLPLEMQAGGYRYDKQVCDREMGEKEEQSSSCGVGRG